MRLNLFLLTLALAAFELVVAQSDTTTHTRPTKQRKSESPECLAARAAGSTAYKSCMADVNSTKPLKISTQEEANAVMLRMMPCDCTSPYYTRAGLAVCLEKPETAPNVMRTIIEACATRDWKTAAIWQQEWMNRDYDLQVESAKMDGLPAPDPSRASWIDENGDRIDPDEGSRPGLKTYKFISDPASEAKVRNAIDDDQAQARQNQTAATTSASAAPTLATTASSRVSAISGSAAPTAAATAGSGVLATSGSPSGVIVPASLAVMLWPAMLSLSAVLLW
ncbi:hypothetical protein HDU86_001253 [Geranomyces michiganensis]|nr:hypothetical protein HDU86_001253 [Geranomyces michiganensis]